MKFGVVDPQTELGGDPEAVRRIGLAAEALGDDYLLAYDHVVGAVHTDREPPLWGPYSENDPFHDPFVLFAYLAGMTETLEFATGVLILPQRQTVLVAKQCADLDLLSGGRLRLGVGVGWNYVEYDALGQPFETRGRRLNEQIPYLRQLWHGEVSSLDGEFDRLDRGVVIPGPRRQIPVWVGGFSPPAFRRGVDLGDGFMFAGKESAVYHALDAVRSLAPKRDRPLDDFGLEYLALRASDVGETVDEAQRWRETGGTHFGAVSMNAGRDSLEAHVDFFSDVADRLDLASAH
ncbi:LLM class F420-dependent oxidoreductase [Ilumatobacter nonamiensis]|uniref:LLM class F420-dependent oxidoreductase n=1 Tax=Ilumatobacter nonamiensis TaxID=467093 RepID=UPI00058BFCC7|nr:LLM class F420-dependent oxidoreductase [Ilumatobacter nonamiensis]